MGCGECKFFGFLGLQRHCRHPEHPLPIRQWPGQCGEFVDQNKKFMPGKPQPWPEPVKLKKQVDTHCV